MAKTRQQTLLKRTTEIGELLDGAMRIDSEGLEGLTPSAIRELEQLCDAGRFLLAIKMIGEGRQIWELVRSRARIHENGEYDGFEFPDGSILGTTAHSYETWERLSDWQEYFSLGE